MASRASGSTDPGESRLVSHPRAKSKVWKYFGFAADADGCIVQWRRICCRLCHAHIAYSGNTSNLSYHLEKNHPVQYCELGPPRVLRAESSPGPSPAPSPSESPQQPQPQEDCAPSTRGSSLGSDALTAAVRALLVEALLPVRVVDEPAFRVLLRTAAPRYELPDRKCFLRDFRDSSARLREALRQELAEVTCCGLSADAWAGSQNQKYVTLTVHHLQVKSQGLGLTSRCLKTIEVPEDSTPESLARVLYSVFLEWGLGGKVSAATTDSGDGDLAQASSLLDIPVHLTCLASTLDSGICEALRLPRLSALLMRCHRLVSHIHGCSMAQCSPSGTSGWIRTLAMLRQLRNKRQHLVAALPPDGHGHALMLEGTEWNTLDGLLALLRPLHNVAEVLSTAKHPTLSMVKPLLHMLLSTALRTQDSDPKEISLAKDLIARELSRKYLDNPEVDLFLSVAAFLDPRYKRLPFLSAFARQQVESRVIQEAKALMDRGLDNDFRPGITEDPSTQEPPAKKFQGDWNTELPSTAVNTMLAEIFSQAGGTEDQDEGHAQVLEELSNFKAQKVLGLSEDPLKWWSERLALFPVLPKVLHKYWCVVPTRAPPERLFGPAGTVVSAKRNGLAPAHVDNQVFLYENTRTTAEPELEDEDEDEGDWSLGQDAAMGANAGIFRIKDGGFL